MKYLLIFLGLLPFNSIAMQGPYFVCKTDSNGDILVRDQNGGWVKETYTEFFCSSAETASEDDSAHLMRVKKSLFIHLCVQASKAQGCDKYAFQELLHKIKSGAIDKSAPVVTMTIKDGMHRLLSYIPFGSFYCIVNNKKVKVSLESFETEQDTVENLQIPKAPPFVFGQSYNPSHSLKFKKSGCEISAGDFAGDMPHHAKIVAEFEELIK
ncbi:hypothetical protein BH09DEP1_BH09DEP1_1730 [soil metagenome]